MFAAIGTLLVYVFWEFVAASLGFATMAVVIDVVIDYLELKGGE